MKRSTALFLVSLIKAAFRGGVYIPLSHWAIALEWLERAGSDPGRLAFVPGDGVVSFVNSTDLRRIVAEGGVSHGPAASRGGFPSGARRRPTPRTGAGEQRTRNKTKNNTTYTQCTPRAAKTRAMQLCPIHSDVKSCQTERQRPHQTPEDPKSGPCILVTCPSASFLHPRK